MSVNKRKRKNVVLLSMFAVTVILLVFCVVFAFKLGSLQSQIDDLKEARALKLQMEVASANAAVGQEETKVAQATDGQDGENEPSNSQNESSATAAPEQSTEPDEADVPEAEPTDTDGTRYVYLTFDDGPSKNTERILAILDQYNVKATFFVNGREDAVNMDRYHKIADAGHTLAMHSYSHDYEKMYACMEAFVEDYERISALIESVTGERPTLYRFPGGSSNKLSVRKVSMTALADFLHGEGVEYFDWNVDTTDGEGPNRDPAVLISNVANSLKNEHNVILMHDAGDHDTTVDALPSIIQTCIDQGLTFSVISADTPAVHHTISD